MMFYAALGPYLHNPGLTDSRTVHICSNRGFLIRVACLKRFPSSQTGAQESLLPLLG